MKRLMIDEQGIVSNIVFGTTELSSWYVALIILVVFQFRMLGRTTRKQKPGRLAWYCGPVGTKRRYAHHRDSQLRRAYSYVHC